LPADHHFNHLLARQLPDRSFANIGTIAQHAYSIGDRKDLIEPVADIDNADSVRLQVAHDR
jgi:hypothetical protein